jgi:hypothetical protein
VSETAEELVLQTAIDSLHGMCVGPNLKESFRRAIDDVECEAFYSTDGDAHLVLGNEEDEIRREKFDMTLLAGNRIGLELTRIHDEVFNGGEHFSGFSKSEKPGPVD